jgi:hypothetical protein
MYQVPTAACLPAVGLPTVGRRAVQSRNWDNSPFTRGLGGIPDFLSQRRKEIVICLLTAHRNPNFESTWYLVLSTWYLLNIESPTPTEE